jgi:HprK-related kinase A
MKAPGTADRRVGALSSAEWSARLSGGRIGVRVGPFDLHLRVGVEAIHVPLQKLYRDYPLLEGERVYSCHADLQKVWGFGRRPGRKVRFRVDGIAPHEDMPADQALAVLEWGINLAIAMRFHGYLMLHAAVVARNGRGLLMPASPGHGKSTFCAALVHRGWRLFSDEFGLLVPGEGVLMPAPRPISLKNQSIEVLRSFAHESELGPTIPNTRKGTVAHVKAPGDSVAQADLPARAAWVVFPRWVAGAPLALEEVGKSEAFMQVATNAFNYELLGESAYRAVREVIAAARCFRLVYSDLEQAVAALTGLADTDDQH